MLASQLCAFDDNTDFVGTVYFVTISICDTLSQFNGGTDKVKVSGLNSMNYSNQNFHRVLKVLLLISLPQKAQEEVLNGEITVTK